MTLGGAMIMTMFNGPMLSLPWAKIDNHHDFGKAANNQVSIKGALMITAGCVSWSSFIVLQVRISPASNICAYSTCTKYDI